MADRTLEVVFVRQQATQYLLQERTVRAAHGSGADFLVVGADQHAGMFALGREQGLQTGEARQQVIQPCPAMKSPCRPMTAALWVS